MSKRANSILTVKDLIELLKRVDPNAEIKIDVDNTWYDVDSIQIIWNVGVGDEFVAIHGS